MLTTISHSASSSFRILAGCSLLSFTVAPGRHYTILQSFYVTRVICACPLSIDFPVTTVPLFFLILCAVELSDAILLAPWVSLLPPNTHQLMNKRDSGLLDYQPSPLSLLGSHRPVCAFLSCSVSASLNVLPTKSWALQILYCDNSADQRSYSGSLVLTVPSSGCCSWRFSMHVRLSILYQCYQ